jgi:tetratricopeptide (TPR) repeat protein
MMPSEPTPPVSPQGETQVERVAKLDDVFASQERFEGFLLGKVVVEEIGVVGPAAQRLAAEHGFSLFDHGRYSEAKQLFKCLLSVNPLESYYLTALGTIHLCEEDYAEAERFLSRAIELNPNEVTNFVNRGEIFIRQGRLAEAVGDLSRVKQLDPTAKHPLSRRAMSLARAALETLTKGEASGLAANTGKAAVESAKPTARPQVREAKPAAKARK